MAGNAEPALDVAITQKIHVIRGHRVMLDSDLAALYGVTTKRFNEAVARNAGRFPEDFMFLMSNQELGNLRSQFATSSSGYGGRRYPPRAFTEHGAIMAAAILKTARAEQMSVYVVRAFVRLRAMLASNAALARKLEALEKSVAALDSDTRHRFDQVYEAILGLMTPATKRQQI
jgi:hypothetical protein